MIKLPKPHKPSSTFLFLKHCEHSIGNHKATNHVKGAEQYGQKTQDKGQIIVGTGVPHYDNGAYDDHSVNGVCPRHQGRVQNSRHIRYHLDTQQDTKDDNVNKVLIFKKKIGHDLTVDDLLIQIFKGTRESAFRQNLIQMMPQMLSIIRHDEPECKGL